MQTVSEFISAKGIKFEAVQIDSRPDGGGDWDAAASHYRVVFKRGRKRLTTYFSMGPAHTAGPKAAGVLDSLAQDASYVLDEGANFSAFCRELGYDEDSRKAERIHKACLRIASSLERFLGVGGRETLLYSTERL